MKMTKSDIEAATEAALHGATVQYHHFEGTCLTVCAITPTHGFTVFGTACSINYEDFDPALGKEIAFNKAKDELWVHEGYRGVAQ